MVENLKMGQICFFLLGTSKFLKRIISSVIKSNKMVIDIGRSIII